MESFGSDFSKGLTGLDEQNQSGVYASGCNSVPIPLESRWRNATPISLFATFWEWRNAPSTFNYGVAFLYFFLLESGTDAGDGKNGSDGIMAI